MAWPPTPVARARLPALPVGCQPGHPLHRCTGRGFKALKQIIKIQSRLGNAEEMLAAYRQLLQARHAHVACRGTRRGARHGGRCVPGDSSQGTCAKGVPLAGGLCP